MKIPTHEEAYRFLSTRKDLNSVMKNSGAVRYEGGMGRAFGVEPNSSAAFGYGLHMGWVTVVVTQDDHGNLHLIKQPRHMELLSPLEALAAEAEESA